jgi:hypothetical protein
MRGNLVDQDYWRPGVKTALALTGVACHRNVSSAVRHLIKNGAEIG